MKYFFQTGEKLKIRATFDKSGCIDENLVPQAVRHLFSDQKLRATQVIIVHKDINQDNPEKAEDGYVWSYSKVE